MNTDALTPELLEDALKDWDLLALLAYDGFTHSGRGVVALEQVPEDVSPLRVRASYITFPLGQPSPETARLVSAYDPDEEMVLLYREPVQGFRTKRLRAGPDLRTPKRVWFFEQLRRMEEDEQYAPERAPAWFWEVLEKLTQENGGGDV